MQRILKFVEKSSLVEEFKVHDFKTGEGFAYIKLEILFKNSSRMHIREFVSAKQRKYSFHWAIDDRTNIRWDNSPHHKHIQSYPHHLHINQDVFPSECTNPISIFTWIEGLIGKNIDLCPELLRAEIESLCSPDR